MLQSTMHKVSLLGMLLGGRDLLGKGLASLYTWELCDLMLSGLQMGSQPEKEILLSSDCNVSFGIGEVLFDNSYTMPESASNKFSPIAVDSLLLVLNYLAVNKVTIMFLVGGNTFKSNILPLYFSRCSRRSGYSWTARYAGPQC